MTWDSLTAAKNVSGSLANWVSYTLLDIPPIVDEAQSLLYASLRCREMMSAFYFTLSTGQVWVPLPTGFLDPIGRIMLPTITQSVIRRDQNTIMTRRTYSENSGTLGTNPFTTATGSAIVAVNLPSHGFNQGSPFNIQGATAVNNITPNGTFPIVSIIDANNFNIDTTVLGQIPNASGAGGGSAVNYVVDNLVAGPPREWAIWDEAIQFDVAAAQQYQGHLGYFRSLPLLSHTNPSNFLTNRYPQLVRKACQVAAADFMEDDAAYQKGVPVLEAMIASVNVENEGQYRGMELETGMV
jgi:hypothetical protein